MISPLSPQGMEEGPHSHYIEKGYRREKGYLLLTLYTDASKGG